jgi:hypothetical protein
MGGVDFKQIEAIAAARAPAIAQCGENRVRPRA